MTLTSETDSREETRLGDRRDDSDIGSSDGGEMNCDFDEVVRRHQPQVARLAHRLLGWRDRDAVEDVVQEVFLIAWRRMKSFRGDSSLGTWLIGITINQCRAQRRRSLLRLKWLREAFATGNSSQPIADGPAAGEETSQQVRDAVARLPPRDREVIVLFYLEALSVAQIAQLLGVKNNAIEVRLHRARTRLKTQLAGLIGD